MTEEEIRLDQTKKVFEVLADFVINGSASYRYLIYDKLGFECKDYADLIAGLTITNAIVELEDLRKENQKLKKQLNYLRSGEYYNQLRFERDMLQNVIDNGEVSKEDKEFIDMTHRNTELLEENEELKKQLEEWGHHLKCSKEILDIQGQIEANYDYDKYMLGFYNGMEYIIALFETRKPNYINGKDVKFTSNKTQQKKFIKFLEDEIKQNTPSLRWKHYNEDGFNDYDVENPSCIEVQPTYKVLKEVLQKYKEIIGE